MTDKFTGKSRYRIQHRFLKSPLVVLQLEVNKEHVTNAGGVVDITEYTMFVDATPEDIINIGSKND